MGATFQPSISCSAAIGAKCTRLSPSSGTKASRNTSDRMRSGIRSATPETTKPAYEWPHSTMSVSSSQRIRLSTSCVCVCKSTPADNRCERSPTPVKVG